MPFYVFISVYNTKLCRLSKPACVKRSSLLLQSFVCRVRRHKKEMEENNKQIDYKINACAKNETQRHFFI